MANVQVRNSATGQILSIPQDQVAFMSSQWSVYTAPAPTPTPAPAPAPAPTPSAPAPSAPSPTGTSAPAASTLKNWVAVSGNTIYLNGAIVQNGQDANDARQRANELATRYGAPYVGSFPVGYNLTQWASQNGYQTNGTPPPLAAPTPAAPAPAVSGQTPGVAGDVNVGNANVGNLIKTVSTAAFKSTAAYAALPQGLKDFVDIAYNLIEVGGEAEAKFFANAIAQAQAVADPYYKTQLALAKAEVMGSIAEKNNDYETRSEIITRARDEMMQDVGANKEFLSLEQQAEIARMVKDYDGDILQIADEAAEKGLTFATGARSRALAEERRSTQYADVVQSSQRRFNMQKRELELKASRGETAAQKELAALNASKGFALQGIGRAAEEVLGSANLPAIPGYNPTGGTLGSIEEAKRKAVASDVSGFMQLQKGFI